MNNYLVNYLLKHYSSFLTKEILANCEDYLVRMKRGEVFYFDTLKVWWDKKSLRLKSKLEEL